MSDSRRAELERIVARMLADADQQKAAVDDAIEKDLRGDGQIIRVFVNSLSSNDDHHKADCFAVMIRVWPYFGRLFISAATAAIAESAARVSERIEAGNDEKDASGEEGSLLDG